MEDLRKVFEQITWQSLREFYFLAVFLIVIMQLIGVRLVDRLVAAVVALLKRNNPQYVEDPVATKDFRDLMIVLVIYGIALTITLILRDADYGNGDAFVNSVLASALSSGGYEHMKQAISALGYKWK